MADFVFTVSKGYQSYYATLPAANDALIVVPIEASGIEADSTLGTYTNLGSLLASTNNEQTTMGRKTLAGVTVTPNYSTHTTTVDANDVSWTSASGNAIAALVICYAPDTTTGTDSDLIPVLKLDCSLTPDGSNFTAQFATNGLCRML